MVVTCTEYSGGYHAGDADANAGGDRLQGAGSKGSLVGSTPLPVRGGGGGYEGDKASPSSSAPFRIRKLRAGDTLDKQARPASSTSTTAPIRWWVGLGTENYHTCPSRSIVLTTGSDCQTAPWWAGRPGADRSGYLVRGAEYGGCLVRRRADAWPDTWKQGNGSCHEASSATSRKDQSEHVVAGDSSFFGMAMGTAVDPGALVQTWPSRHGQADMVSLLLGGESASDF